VTQEEWKKNDSLMRAALKKMKLNFRRNLKTWEPEVYISRKEVTPFDSDDVMVEGVGDPESLGYTRYFLVKKGSSTSHELSIVNNIFFGVESYAELKIKLDLMG